MSNPNDFLEPTKRFLALRAGYVCSFRGCNQFTVGPSDESPTAFTNVGDAAHICAAAPGGRRYVAEMTSEQRRDISNGIWLCAMHARLVDRDQTVYTIEELRAMKSQHEAACAARVRLNAREHLSATDLLAIGPEIVCTSELLQIKQKTWSLRLSHFVVGELNKVVALVDRFDQISMSDKYLCLNSLGEGRLLSAAPVLRKVEGDLIIDCEVAANYPRISAENLGSRFAISDQTNDMYLENGQLARVSGVKSLTQTLRSALSIQRGEFFASPSYGVRFAEYLGAFRDSPWLSELLKLDVIRQAAIPHRDEVTQKEHTPLQCVDRVREVVVTSEDKINHRLNIRLELELTALARGSANCRSIYRMLCREAIKGRE